MIIERKNDEVIFRLRGNVNLDDLQDIADVLEFKEIASTSKATQKEVADLVKEIKKGRWEKRKSDLDL